MIQLFCESCHEPFNCSLNRPISYPCGHTFCFKCVKKSYLERSYILCSVCKYTHQGHFSKLATNYAILEILLRHTDEPILISKIDYNEIVTIKNEISFTLKKQQPKRKIFEHKEYFQTPQNINEYPSLFNYFELMRQIITYTDKNKNYLIGKLFNFIFKPFMFFFLMIINWFIFLNYDFGYLFLFLSIIYERNNNISDISKKTKMLIMFAFLMFVESILDDIGVKFIMNAIMGQNVLSCFRTIFIIIILGNEHTLNWGISSLLKIMNNMNLILT
jgi:hypothetical protein